MGRGGLGFLRLLTLDALKVLDGYLAMFPIGNSTWLTRA